MKTVVMVHGWGGSPNGDWFQWMKSELEKKNFKVIVPEMPNTFFPTIKEWVAKLNEIINPDKDTYLIGHSIGCQTVMRYLEQLPIQTKIGGVIFVAGWFNLSDGTWDEKYTKEIAKQWIETPISFEKIKQHTNKFLAIQSDNDPYVPLEDKEIFKEKLNTKVVLLHNKGHMASEDGAKDLPELLKQLLEMAK